MFGRGFAEEQLTAVKRMGYTPRTGPGPCMDQDFRLGSWTIRPSLNNISFNNRVARLEPKAMEVLVCLAKHDGEVTSKEELIRTVWANTFVGDDVLTRCISDLRKAFDDDPKAPRVIETIPKRGYRLLETVEPLASQKPNWIEQIVSAIRRLRSRERTRGSIIVAVFMGLAFVLVVKSSPWIARVYNNRGVVLQNRGDLTSAIHDYQRAISLNSRYAEAHYNMADAYEEIPSYDKALEQYQLAIDADAAFYPAYNNLSRLYILRRRDYGSALRLLDHALSLGPKEPSVRYSLYKNYGWANLELHNLGQAEQNLRSAVGLDGGRGGAHCLLAKVLDAQGKADSALGEWESCVAYSESQEVEPEWRNEAQERLRKQ
jgi:DNA-binding winged helix-turn-helix (wHTH) protein/Tfp pilus assembly protein PilF